MSTNLDKIMVSIGADLKDLEKGFAEATSKTRKFETEANKIGEKTGKAYTGGFLSKIKDGSLERGLQSSFNKMGNIASKGMLLITGPILAAGGALVALSKKAGNTADRLLDLEQITGMSTNTIQEWQYAAAGAGVGSEAMTKAVEGLIRKLPQLEDGTGKAAESFSKLGLNYEDIKKQAPEKQMDDIVYALAGMDSVMERNAIGAQLFGGAWTDIAPLLGEGADGLKKLRQEARDLGAVLDKETLTASNEFRAEMDKLKLRAEVFGTEIGAKLAPMFSETLVPAIERGMDSLSKFADKIAEMDQEDLVFFAKLALGLAIIPPAIMAVSKLGKSFLLVYNGAKWAVEGIKGFQLASATAHLPLMGALALLTASVALFVGTLWNAEDESTVVAQGIGDKFGALGQRVIGLVQMVAGIGTSIVGMGVSLMSSLVQSGLDKLQFLLDAASKVPILGKGAEWASGKVGGASDWIQNNKNKVMYKGQNIMNDGLYRQDNPMDAYISSQVKKGKIDGKGLEFEGSFLSDKSLNKVNKDRQKTREREISNMMPNYNKLEVPEIPKVDAFADSVDKIKDALKEMGDSFQNTVEGLGGSIGLFDRFRVKTTSTYRLIRNSAERSRAFQERESALQSLESKGLSKDLMNQLHNTSINDLANIKGLDNMSADQLKQWAGSQNVAERSIERQAIAQTVYNNEIIINVTKANSEEAAKEIMKELKRRGVTYA